MGDLAESSNHSIGADSHRSVLLSGCVNSASMLASMSLSTCPKFNELYEVVATLINSEIGLSATHLNEIPVAFAGSLEFQNQDGGVEAPIVHLPHAKPETISSAKLSRTARRRQNENVKKLMEKLPP